MAQSGELTSWWRQAVQDGGKWDWGGWRYERCTANGQQGHQIIALVMEMNGGRVSPHPASVRPPGDTRLDSKHRIGPAWTRRPTYYFNRQVRPERGAAVAKVIDGGGRGESIMFDHKNIQPQPDGFSPANTATVMDRWEWRPHLHVEWEIESSECERQLAQHPHKHISPFCSCSSHVWAFLMRISMGSGWVWAVWLF